MNLSLKGKHALVCGASQGIGLAAARELAMLGARVTLMARNADKLKVAVEGLPIGEHEGHGFVVADFSKHIEVSEVAQKLVDSSGVDILINNTGGPKGGAISEATVEEFTNTFEQHLLCNHVLAQAVLPGMRERGHGRIVNVISTSVKAPLNGLGVSNTIRGAVANWSKTLANEEGKHGIRVNNVLPGATNTERLQNIIEAKAAKGGVSTDVIQKSMAGAVPAGRFGEPEEIGGAIAFLCTPAADYISGISLPVDGGRTASL
ncbi:MAG TPA: SDR family oxidoreductase [Flavobacteriales bacterium]|nr:SDR family oxidoreductase [Flavobacteriales bacterium]HIO16705.1 SDR family oxidoreductase [Flavobacteriales bacterium]HIO59956.1 SDR family oxidoreductase [Flavobacteriales bacterium]